MPWCGVLLALLLVALPLCAHPLATADGAPPRPVATAAHPTGDRAVVTPLCVDAGPGGGARCHAVDRAVTGTAPSSPLAAPGATSTVVADRAPGPVGPGSGQLGARAPDLHWLQIQRT